MIVLVYQGNPTCAAVKQNTEKVKAQLKEAAKRGAELLVCPELFLLGYPPKDLLAYEALHEQQWAAMEELRKMSKECGVGLLLGHSERVEASDGLYYNAASLYDEGKLRGTYRKRRIPSYDIFDEHRFFLPFESERQKALSFRGKKLGVFICEDAWDSSAAYGVDDIRRHSDENAPWEDLRGCDFMVNLSASPYTIKKRLRRESLFSLKCQELGKPLIYANCVGAQDDLLFDGASFFCDENGIILSQAKIFEEDSLLIDTKNPEGEGISYEHWAELEKALVAGIRDYAQKNSIKKALIGLSGGIDSTLVAALAARALGASNVKGISMPSELTGNDSLEIARSLSSKLKISFEEVSIKEPVALMSNRLDLNKSSLAFENIQARTRGMILMARANQENALVLATCNKSESAMGYTTLYGDMCGTLAPIADLYKTEVYALAHLIAQRDRVIPSLALDRPPTAELAPNQVDEDSLPPYAVLDTILKEFLENQFRRSERNVWNSFIEHYDLHDIPERVLKMEFKRQQAAPILKVHHRAFGSGWRFPLSKNPYVLSN